MLGLAVNLACVAVPRGDDREDRLFIEMISELYSFSRLPVS